jgi:hypothetical protein
MSEPKFMQSLVKEMLEIYDFEKIWHSGGDNSHFIGWVKETLEYRVSLMEPEMLGKIIETFKSEDWPEELGDLSELITPQFHNCKKLFREPAILCLAFKIRNELLARSQMEVREGDSQT